MNQQTSTLEQQVLVLALLEKPCPHSPGCEGGLGEEGVAEMPCPTCHGTGQVAEFPMLRESCPSSNHQATGPSEWVTKVASNCDRCQGRGWVVPVVTVEALLEAGKPYHLGIWWESTGYSVRYTRPGMSRPDLLRNLDMTPNKALTLALCAAKGIQEVE